MPTRTGNHMIDNLDSEQSTGADQFPSDEQVSRRGGRVTPYAANGISGVMPHSVLCRMACDLPGFDGTNRTPMRHKTVTLSQPFEVGEQLIIGPVSPRLAAQGAHFGEDGLF